MDRLAKEGALFANSICAPSRVTLLTGSIRIATACRCTIVSTASCDAREGAGRFAQFLRQGAVVLFRAAYRQDLGHIRVTVQQLFAAAAHHHIKRGLGKLLL